MVVKTNNLQLVILSAIAIVLAFIVTISGSRQLPPDSHEVFVLQTTQEMHDRADWIIPYFNDEPRLNKPPMSYWLTGFMAWLTDSINAIKPIHGRMASVAAGFGIAALIFLLGIRLYNLLTAILAVFLFITSQCFFAYTHDARPDMLYAFFCTLAITFFIYAVKNNDDSPNTGYLARMIWVSFALATLTKGPQLPFMLLIAMVLFLTIESYERQKILKVIRPVSGILIYLVLVIPWWLLVQTKLDGNGLSGTQLSGTLLKIDWLNLFNGYYIYHPLWLLAPWFLFIPLLIVYVIRRYRHDKNILLLALLYVVPCLILSLGKQQRWYYVLPVLAPLYLLLSESVHYYLLDNKTSILPQYKQLFIYTYFSLAVLTMLWIHFQPDTSHVLTELIIVSIFMFTGIIISYLYKYTNEKNKNVTEIMILMISIGLIISILGQTHLPWSRERFHKAYIAELSNRELSDSTRLYSWQIKSDLYMYYTHRKIPELSTLEQIEAQFNGNNSNPICILLMYKNLKYLKKLSRSYHVEVLNSYPIESEKDVILVRLNKTSNKLVISSS